MLSYNLHTCFCLGLVIFVRCWPLYDFSYWLDPFLETTIFMIDFNNLSDNLCKCWNSFKILVASNNSIEESGPDIVLDLSAKISELADNGWVQKQNDLEHVFLLRLSALGHELNALMNECLLQLATVTYVLFEQFYQGFEWRLVVDLGQYRAEQLWGSLFLHGLSLGYSSNMLLF